MASPIPPFAAGAVLVALLASSTLAQDTGAELGLPDRLADGEEFVLKLKDLVTHGAHVFGAQWTVQEGQGRPQTKGTGGALSDPSDPLEFPRNFNRISAPDSNSCGGCHNSPRAGGAGDFVTNVFVLGQRFDHATFDAADALPTKGASDENGSPVTLQEIAASRQTIGMFGSGYIEMLARQITVDLQALRDGLAADGSVELVSKGVSFGTLARDVGGNWDTGAVEGLSAPSLASSGAGDPPNLIVRPFHQAGAVISLRQFTNNAYNHHHGIQSTERFGAGNDPDDDGVIDELGIADVSASTIFQATLPPPGRVIPKDATLREAIARGEQAFVDVGCSSCHVPCLPLDEGGEVFVEPNPFNPSGNLQPGDVYETQYGSLEVDLNGRSLPRPRLKADKKSGVTPVFAFTDFKLHDITAGPGDPNVEPLDMQQPAGSPGFFGGNGRFLSARLWGVANQMPYYHHGQYTTMREAIEAHAGEADGVMANWAGLTESQRADVLEFLKSLQVLPERARTLVINEKGQRSKWQDFPWECGQDVPALPSVD